MAPARLRALDDSRSETSSTIFNPKEKHTLAVAAGAGVSKQKKNAGPTLSIPIKISANTIIASATAATAAADSNSPRIKWASMAPSLLHVYRTAYHLPTQSCHTHPHADLIYKSSRTALRAPSAVAARRKLRDLKHQRRKTNGTATTINSKAKNGDKDKDTDSSSNSDRLLKPHPATVKDAINVTDVPSTSPDPFSQANPPLQPPITPESIGKQSPASLATAVRKHFNAQQLNEAEVVARFIYVAKQSRNSRGTVRTEGSAGDGQGWWMGSQGREVRRGEGGEVGFRLRFRS